LRLRCGVIAERRENHDRCQDDLPVVTIPELLDRNREEAR